jgi:transcriptional regulator with XRE-family HTH domain
VDIGAIVRETRLAEGLTQAQLAHRLGIKQPSVARLEAAGETASVATLRRALGAMGRTLELHAEPMPSSVDDSQIIEALSLSPGERLERFERSYENVRRFARETQASVGHVA